MRRKDFIQIIKLRSFWKINRRNGNYTLPSGKKLIDYITELINSQMQLDNLGIRQNGDLCFCEGGNWNADNKEFDNYTLMPAFEENEICSFDEMEQRIKNLAREIIC